MAEVDRWSIDKLDSLNWMTWKFQIKHLLLVRGLWGLVEGMEVLQEEANCPANSGFQQEIPEGFLYDGHGNKFVSTLPGNFV